MAISDEMWEKMRKVIREAVTQGCNDYFMSKKFRSLKMFTKTNHKKKIIGPEKHTGLFAI